MRLRDCFNRQYGPSAAARECDVHRNTASTYFSAFKRGEDFDEVYEAIRAKQAAQTTAKERLIQADETVWKTIRRRAAREGITARDLVSRIVKAVVEDDLLDQILGGHPGDGKELIEAINRIVPRTFQDYERADICQELLLAVLEGETTIENLKDGSAECIRRYYKMHPGKFGPASLDAPISGTEGLTLADVLTTDTDHF